MHTYPTRFQTRLQAQQAETIATAPVIQVTVVSSPNPELARDIHNVLSLLDRLHQAVSIKSMIMLNIEVFSYLLLHPALMQHTKIHTTVKNKIREYYVVISENKEKLKAMTQAVPRNLREVKNIVKQAQRVGLLEHLETLCNSMHNM